MAPVVFADAKGCGHGDQSPDMAAFPVPTKRIVVKIITGSSLRRRTTSDVDDHLRGYFERSERKGPVRAPF